MPPVTGARVITEAVLRVDPGADPDALAFAADFAQLVVRALGPQAGLKAAGQAVLTALSARTDLSPPALHTLLEAARAPTARTAASPLAVRAFATRFGPTTAALLAEDAREEIDLASFATLYGTSEALLLLDTLFAVAGAIGGVITRDELESLRSAAQELCIDEVLVTALLRKHGSTDSDGERHHPLSHRRSLTIGRSTTCDICLPDPQVAQVHAELQCIDDTWRVVDQNSGRPTLVNGAPTASAPFGVGATLQIAHYTMRHVQDTEGNSAVSVDGERTFSALSVRNLKRRIGRDLVLLDDVSFTVFTGEVVAVVGPSGAGKTTLLHAISAIAPADSGDVLMDGHSFHRMLAADRSLVGIVPQDDLVHSELTVSESLYYSGRLRFAPDVGPQELGQAVDRVLQELDIAHIRDQRIGDTLQRGISGGQRKRVNLGQELMSRSTRVLFLDEPTSGLDPRASQDIVRQVRQIADRGRIVFLVTHDLTPEVMAQVDHLLVLAPGGRLAFFGPPDEAVRYFGVRTPDAIFNRFGDHPPETWAALFRESDLFRKYVTTRDHLLGVDGVDRGEDVAPRHGRVAPFHQLSTLVRRYARVRLRDRTGMAVLAVQPVFLALVTGVVFPAPSAPFFFMLSLSCLWFGMSAAVRELISDRAIFQREARIGVGVLPYVGAKALVLGSMTILQCALLAGILHGWLDLGSHGFAVPTLLGLSGLIGITGMSIGLLISSVWSSSEAAVGTLPLFLIPQIAFSSIMVGIRDMGPVARAFTWITIQRYSFDAIIKCGEKVSVAGRGDGVWDALPIRGTLYTLGLKPDAAADNLGLTLAELVAIHGGVSVAALVLAVAIVHRNTRRNSR